MYDVSSSVSPLPERPHQDFTTPTLPTIMQTLRPFLTHTHTESMVWGIWYHSDREYLLNVFNILTHTIHKQTYYTHTSASDNANK